MNESTELPLKHKDLLQTQTRKATQTLHRLTLRPLRQQQHRIDTKRFHLFACSLRFGTGFEGTNLYTRFDAGRNAFLQQSGLQFFGAARIGKDAGLHGKTGEQF